MATILRQPPLVFPATARHTATVIFIHGLGDTGHGWSSAVENWRRRQRLDEVKFILPHAPIIPITCNGGFRMPGWYDIHTLDGNPETLRRHEDEPGIRLSQAYFHDLIQKEIEAGIPSNRIVIGGFSQGGAMSLFAGLTAKVKLAGIVALSSYLALSLKFPDIVAEAGNVNKDTPIFMAHGDMDRVVHTEMGKKSYQMLKDMGYNVKLNIYEDMAHSACLEELDDVEAFLNEQLPPLGNAGSDAKPEL